jgi:sulfur carrier protein ThiS
MRITLKLFAAFRRYLPPNSQGHAHGLDVPADTRVRDVLAQFGVPVDGTVILVNGRTAIPERVLEEDDVLAVFPAIAGG